MDTVKLDTVYVPTIKNHSVHITEGPRPQQTVAKPRQSAKEFVIHAAEECKKTAVIVTSAVVFKLFSVGRSVMNYLKKDYLKKEGVPFKGLVMYKGATKGLVKK